MRHRPPRSRSDQKKEDFILAIHHYQRYLALRPNAEKKELIGELVRLAKLSYAASLPDKPSEAIQEIARLQLEISNLRKDLSESRKEAFCRTHGRCLHLTLCCPSSYG